MKAKVVRGLALIGAVSALGACSAFQNLGGAKKVSPDEFRIVAHAPLAMPPNADLRPPQPGAPRPQEQTPADEARSIVTGTGGGTAPAGARGRAPAGGPSAGESALLARTGQSGPSVDPDIRSKVNRESRVIADSNRSVIDSLIFWQDTPAPGVVLDPAKEQQRLRESQASGTDPNKGGTPTIERRRRGMLEGIF
ncbi:DUF3035 domain-containing protein [Reyranella sp. CPCC 100927]|uniref:DUF3035 domain-containing protein n=1 Tax=Reyranella sp. CPCC 100927 TaxID=2599616 RepID=UPI0011B5350C|nr:DUF3035 domain-containing protein [Reyranella sp. CPCC 100927]TWT05132.1 DUF3035 domain-containing protein [Reyranella sp. CPCC 100927]